MFVPTVFSTLCHNSRILKANLRRTIPASTSCVFHRVAFVISRILMFKVTYANKNFSEL